MFLLCVDSDYDDHPKHPRSSPFNDQASQPVALFSKPDHLAQSRHLEPYLLVPRPYRKGVVPTQRLKVHAQARLCLRWPRHAFFAPSPQSKQSPLDPRRLLIDLTYHVTCLPLHHLNILPTRLHPRSAACLPTKNGLSVRKVVAWLPSSLAFAVWYPATIALLSKKSRSASFSIAVRLAPISSAADSANPVHNHQSPFQYAEHHSQHHIQPLF